MQKKSGLFEATAWYGIGNFIVRLVGFILLPLYSNLIPVDQFGVYSLLMSTYAVAGVFYQFGLNAALTNFYLQENDESKRKIIFSTVLSSIIIFGLLLTIVGYLISSFLSIQILGSENYGSLLIILIIVIFLETLSNFILQLYKTLELSKKVVYYLLMGAIINLVLNIWFVYGLKWGIEGIIYAHLTTASLVFVNLLPLVRNHYVLNFDKKLLRVIVLFSVPLFLSGLFSAGMDVADRFILDHFFGKKEVGEYSFAYRLAMITNIFVISFRTAWIPYALNKFKEPDYKVNFGKILVKVIAIGVFILLAVSFFADDLFNIKFFEINLFNPAYKGGLIILPFVVIAYLFSSLTAFYSLYPYTVNRSSYFLISDGVGIISNLILNFILIPLYGLLGAGIATAISFFISFAYLYTISKGKVEVLYMKKEMLIISLSGLAILLLGINYNIFLLQFSFILLFIVLILFILKLNPSAFLRILQ